MAITDSQKVDYLFKKVGYSVAKTDTSSVKSPSNESIASPLVIRGDTIWAQSDEIPTAIPSSTAGVVTVYSDANSNTVQTVNDGTASANRTWNTNLTDWIDPSFGSTYQAKVYLATTGNATPQTSGVQLFADGTGSDEWFFDYSSGVLNFIGTSLPSQTFTGKSIFISGARYTGNRGLSAFGNAVFTGNTDFSIINANLIYENNVRVITTATTINVTGDTTGSGNVSNLALTLANTGVTASGYGSSTRIPQITFDSKGRATSAANLILTQVGNLSVSNTTISTISGDIQLNSNIANITVTGNILTNNIAVTSRLDAATAYVSNNPVLTNVSNIVVTGDISGFGNVSNIALTLANTGVTAGVYGSADDEYADRIPKITVDSKGRITNIANVTLTQVGNVTFSNTTISTTANLTLTPANSYIFAGNSIISNVANPVSQQDVVTLNYLTTAIGAAATSLTNGDSLLSLIDSAASRLELTLDSQLIANITANTSTFYNTVNIGNISINGDTISSQGNIYLNAQNTGIVHIVGTDALSIPAGNSSARPLNPELGYIRFNTDTETLEYWTGTEWTYPGAATITSETITPDGVSASYVLSEESTPDGLIVSINGTLQQPFTSYIMTGNLITFIETPQNTDIIEVRSIAAGAVSISSLTYGPTSKVELSTGNINITGNLLPTANVAYDLGSDSLWWRDLYMSGSTIHIGGALLKVVNNALSFTPAGTSTPINLSNDINPSLLYAGNSNVTVTTNFINVAVNNSNIASFSSLGLAIPGNISANNFNYANGVSILNSITSSLATLTSNAAVQSGLITDTNTAITTANTALKGYVDAANTIQSNQITTVANSVIGANAAIVTANTNLKGYTDNLVTTANVNLTGYVDAANTIQSNQVAGANSAITTANTNMKGYVDGQISTTTTAITTANTNLKGYVDGQISTTTTAITTANTNLKGYVDGQISTTTTAITTANTNLKGYVDGQITSLINGAPGTLDTLNEIANALGSDANLSVTLTSLIANVQSNVTTSNTAMKGYVDAVTTAWTANAATQLSQITAANAAIVTANTAMKGYVDAQDTIISNSVTGANAAIVTANTAMKGYVDAANTIQSNEITAVTNSVTGANAAIVTANTALKGYVDAQDTIISNSVTGANAAIVTANTAMKGYVDAANTIQTNQITTVSSSVTGANAAIVTANTAMKGYVDAVTTAWTANAGAQAGIIASLTNYANANVTAYLPTHSGNIGASTLNLSANITFSSTNVPHRIRGDFSTAFTSVSLKNKVFFQSSGATDDTYIRVLGGGGSGIGGIQLYGTYDPDNSTVLQLDSVPGLQSRIVSYANGTATAVPLRISAGSTDVVIGTSGLVEVSGNISATNFLGTATTALNAIGHNQTWQQFTVPTQRASGTTYTNSTGRPICISVRLEQDDGNMSLTVAGLMIGRTGYTAGPVYYTLTAIIPAGSTYIVTSTGTSATQLFWYELR